MQKKIEEIKTGRFEAKEDDEAGMLSVYNGGGSMRGREKKGLEFDPKPAVTARSKRPPSFGN